MVLRPLLLFKLHEFIGNHSERTLDHLVFTQLAQRLVERLREQSYPPSVDLCKPEFVKVSRVRLARVEFSYDTVHSGRYIGSEGKVRVTGRRDGPVFEVPRPGRADHLRTVVIAIRDECRRPVKT